MKRIAYVVGMAFLFSFIVMTYPVQAETAKKEAVSFKEDAKAAILLEQDSDQVLYEKNAHDTLPPASMTKIMTLLLVMEAIEQEELSLSEEITVSEYAASMGGTQVFLAQGEQMTVDDLIKAVAIASANDASVALAERIAGSEEAFVQRMNDKVAQLQLKHTQFQNSSGLPAKDHYTTAYDMAMIAKELLKYDQITQYTSIYEDYLRKGEENEFWLVNTNKLVRFYPHVDGLKTGYTSEAKFCLTATAKKEDMRVVAVVMGAETSKERNALTMKLLDYAFHHYEAEKVYDKNEKVTSLRHIQAEKIEYDVQVGEQISLLHKKGEKEKMDFQSEITLHEAIELPVEKGGEVGVIRLKNGDDLVAESPLIVEEKIEIASFLTLIKRSMQNIAKYTQ